HQPEVPHARPNNVKPTERRQVAVPSAATATVPSTRRRRALPCSHGEPQPQPRTEGPRIVHYCPIRNVCPSPLHICSGRRRRHGGITSVGLKLRPVLVPPGEVRHEHPARLQRRQVHLHGALEQPYRRRLPL
ncbi:unnamed protein product, partial [Ectocarpus sp. 8 AP-2014]